MKSEKDLGRLLCARQVVVESIHHLGAHVYAADDAGDNAKRDDHLNPTHYLTSQWHARMLNSSSAHRTKDRMTYT